MRSKNGPLAFALVAALLFSLAFVALPKRAQFVYWLDPATDWDEGMAARGFEALAAFGVRVHQAATIQEANVFVVTTLGCPVRRLACSYECGLITICAGKVQTFRSYAHEGAHLLGVEHVEGAPAMMSPYLDRTRSPLWWTAADFAAWTARKPSLIEAPGCRHKRSYLRIMFANQKP